MWIKLSRTKGGPTLVALDKVRHIVQREPSGSTIYFDAESYEGKARAVAVNETIDEIAGMLPMTGPAVAKKSAKK